ncbi:hypothetical protein DRP53_00275 [candidate division WOR-3 bacterium]|uniref:Uncharacterized protein n=1 Tax=candidate division WOR-3 bacterium TaxID=2052148 RepID=A0A660SLX3_UNCW3|nr:MAG: hypothetical protein DRP53_00275 [candidate division WOR-3 bacterium]
MNPCEQLFNCVEDHSNYSHKLRERYLKEDRFEHFLNLIRNGMGLLRLPTQILAPYEDQNDFYLELKSDDPKEEYQRILSEDPEKLLILEVAFRKLGADAKTLIRLREGYNEKGQVLARIFDEVRIKTRPKLNDGIDIFRRELEKFILTPELFLMAHDAMAMAFVDYELDRIVEVEPITTPADILGRLPKVIRNHLSPAARQKLLKIYRKETERILALHKEELKESELFLIRTHERLKEIIDELSRELKETLFKMEKLVNRTDVIRHINQLTSKLQRALLIQLHHFQDHEAKRKESLRILEQLEKLEVERPTFDLLTIYEEIIFFRIGRELPAKIRKRFTEYLIGMIDEEIRSRRMRKISILREYERKGMLGTTLDTDLIMENYLGFIRKVFLPVMIGELLKELVLVWPYGDRTKDFGYFAGIHLKPKSECPKRLVHFINSLRKTISVLTYDIRGSTYMGTRLRNAEKEWKIKYKFSQIMSGIARRFGGFLLKDTGDGGVVWFGANSKETYDRSYIESIASKGIKIRQSIFSGREFELHPSADAGLRAVQCGLEMVKAAEEFIKVNFIHYRDWFGEVSKREVKVEGVTYALLPPEFRSLFRIGVGIASGRPGRDIFFSVNSYGDPDVVGPLLAESNLYSMGRDPNRSVVIIDSSTLINLLLNSPSFYYDGVSEGPPESIAEEVGKQRGVVRDYLFPDYHFRVIKLGVHLLEEADKLKALDFGYRGKIHVDDEGNFYDQNNSMINLLFEVVGE